MTFFQRRRWFQRGWLSSKIGLGAVLGIFLVSAAANFKAGQALTTDTGTAFTLGLASVCVDIMKSVAFFIMSMSVVNRRWPSLVASLLIFALCASWSLRSATQFMWATMSQHAAERHLAVDIAKTEADLLAIRTQRAGFLSQQSIRFGERGTRSARLDAIGENKRTSSEFQSLVREIETTQEKMKHSTPTLAEDPLASVLKLPEKTVFTLSALIFALILEVVSSFGFWVIMQARTPRPLEALPAPELEPPRAMPVLADASAMVMMVAPEEPAERVHFVRGETSVDTPPMPEVIAATGKVLPFRPRLVEKEVVAAHPPEEPEVPIEAVEQDIGEIQQIVRGLFQAMPGERWLYKAVVDLINTNLPTDKRIMAPYLYAQVIMPAILAEIPGVTKVKTGGRVYLTGLRPRSLDAREGTSNG